MKQLRIVCLALVSVCMLGVLFVASASAVKCEKPKCLPDIHFLVGEKEAEITGVVKGVANVAKLTTEIGTELEALELKIVASLKELSALGPIALTFVNVKEAAGKKEKCDSEGQIDGTVSIPKGEYHLVFIKYVPLTVGLLILFPELTIECPLKGIKIKFKGPIVTSVSGLTDMVDTTEFKVGAKCKGVGKQELTSYFNEEAVEQTKQLILANFGLGFENGCEELKEELTLKSTKMLEPLL